MIDALIKRVSVTYKCYEMYAHRGKNWYKKITVSSICLIISYILPYDANLSQCIYFHMVRNRHNVYTSIWYELVIV
jgi:hypothetical protein